AIFITLVDGTKDVPKEFDDIKLKLDSIHDLPDGAGPINFVKDFGDTAGLMLTVASPKIGQVEINLRAHALRRAVEEARRRAPASDARLTPSPSVQRVAIAHGLPSSIPATAARPALDLFIAAATGDGLLRDARILEGPGFVGVDAATDADDAALERYTRRF